MMFERKGETTPFAAAKPTGSAPPTRPPASAPSPALVARSFRPLPSLKPATPPSAAASIAEVAVRPSKDMDFRAIGNPMRPGDDCGRVLCRCHRPNRYPFLENLIVKGGLGSWQCDLIHIGAVWAVLSMLSRTVRGDPHEMEDPCRRHGCGHLGRNCARRFRGERSRWNLAAEELLT